MPDKPTEVMSLDELMDLAAERRPEAATMPIRRPLPTTPAAPAPLNPAAPRPTPKPARTEPALRDRVRADARQAYDAALEQAKHWLKQGDNGLIVATATVLLLLIVVVAAR